ncbi:helix-turn-helix domain-containing protein [Halobacterium yunchengense]|uniref:helix-turn-helix domain-containing protein n=1 Tax=Halobacterium yunchengense TaxID=3108497 RepID=UPI00300B48BE
MSGGDRRGSRLTLDIWHPDCWTLQVTDAGAGGLLGHGVHDVDGRAQGRFTAYADSTPELEALLDRIEDSPLTHDVWGVDQPAHLEVDKETGSATRSIVVEYVLENSINDALVSRGFIPDEPVRMYDGREYWTVVCHEDRERIHDALDEVAAEEDAEIRVDHIASLDAGLGTGMFARSDLSERQREVFRHARDSGYYTWPREVSASELAADLDISKTTLLEHLRKAEAKLLAAHEEPRTE